MSSKILKEPLILLLIVLNSLDAIFTKVFVDQGHVSELNPFMSTLLDRGNWQFLTFKLVTINAFIFMLGLNRFHADHPRMYKTIIFGYGIALMLHLYSVVSVIRVMINE